MRKKKDGDGDTRQDEDRDQQLESTTRADHGFQIRFACRSPVIRANVGFGFKTEVTHKTMLVFVVVVVV
ncbi:hypothetical protein Y032_0015g2614 [Ancylostoma ceylanicum]|uniref:Uncharacterized protein n=1 Tax=Ancylostoma ceylanicum TaxID=53326 RepID=A0A016V9F8_9BILA|nr:hypothetical protein Y032_0015g2614 [Ancylostoma ceylanicum]